MRQVPPHTPVLAGAGVVTQREEDPQRAKEPVALMIAAAQRAGESAGSAELLAAVERIYVPKGRWDYSDPARLIARAIGAPGAVTVLSKVGVPQQTMIGEACQRIAQGESDVVLVAGGEAGYRLLRQQVTGAPLSNAPDTGEPDVLLSPKSELRHPAELRAGMQMPIGLYAIMENAFRVSLGRDVETHMAEINRLYSRFSAIAADNPDAWQRTPLAADMLRPGERNPMQAFPYTRRHCSSWSVDQASALLFCSVEQAQAFGIAQDKWVFPLVSSESNYMAPVSARARLERCVGAAIAGEAALAHAEMTAAEIDLLDLYSCFPLAIELYAAALGLPLSRDMTVTGGMPFAGGPYNNYVLQATAHMAGLLRAGKGRTGLVSTVSGVLTKQGFGIWSRQPGPSPYRSIDVSDKVAAATELREVEMDFRGEAVVAGYTVLHDRGRPARGVVIADTPGGARAVGWSEDPGVAAAMEAREFHGARVRIADGGFVIADQA